MASWSTRPLLAAAVAGAAVALAAAVPALAASPQQTDHLQGVEVWYWPATFVGSATGDLPGSFRTVVEHTPLPKAVGGTAQVTGGTFSLRSARRTVAGSIAPGGTIAYLSAGSGACGDQTFRVTGALANGSGDFDVTLVHHRRTVLGACVVAWATQSGTLHLAA